MSKKKRADRTPWRVLFLELQIKFALSLFLYPS